MKEQQIKNTMESNTTDLMENSIVDKIKQLEDKYAQMGQDLNSYLEGLGLYTG